jgi:hypothetical protein
VQECREEGRGVARPSASLIPMLAAELDCSEVECVGDRLRRLGRELKNLATHRV